VILIQGVSKKYGEKFVLRNVNLSIGAGDFVSMIGPSGAGKSTLLRMLIKESVFHTGKIFVDGEDIDFIRGNQIAQYRRKIGVVFQDFKLLPQKTAFENIAFALEMVGKTTREINEIVPKVLALVSLEDKAHHFPSELSGGEQQRVAIARALIHQPKILFADEPIGNLDYGTGWEIIQLLQRINNFGTTVVMATHDQTFVNTIRRRVVALEDGMVVRDQAAGRYVS